MPRTLSAEQVEEFRARLCAVAQHRFATEGRDAVSMRQLADALGCSPMTPYRYFRNKDEILAAVRAAAFDRFAAALEHAAEQAGEDLRAAGQAVGRGLRRLRDGRPRRVPAHVRRGAARPGSLSGAGARQHAGAAHHERLARAAREGGAFPRRPRAAGLAFWASMHGLVMLHLAGKLPAERDFEAIRGG